MTRMSAAMDDANDDDLRTLYSKVDAKWEAHHQSAACIAMN
jgi:hypothetical protein